MYINGKAKIGKESGEKIEINILMADIFDTNNCFKAMVMCQISDFYDDGTSRDIEVQIFELVSKCNYFECNNLDFGTNFNVKMDKVYLEVDYVSGDIFRLFINQDDEDNTMVSLTKD